MYQKRSRDNEKLYNVERKSKKREFMSVLEEERSEFWDSTESHRCPNPVLWNWTGSLEKYQVVPDREVGVGNYEGPNDFRTRDTQRHTGTRSMHWIDLELRSRYSHFIWRRCFPCPKVNTLRSLEYGHGWSDPCVSNE